MDTFFGNTLIKWYKIHKRDLPWRETKDPYKIWLSEIILQQTQVAQGLAYYYKFIDAYPTVKDLAAASQDDVLKNWQGLGYYSRARNLHETAKKIVHDHKGKFPNTYSNIISLKGIGAYTAAAIASFSYDLPHAVVDGNVYRVLSRVFGIETPINSTNGKVQFQQLADELLIKKQAAIYNQAIMEFGSQQCKPVNPNCEECVLQTKCFAFANDQLNKLPVKLNKTKIKNRYFNYFYIEDKNKTVFINQRKGKDIWEGLFELYLVESLKEADLKQLLQNKDLKKIIGNAYAIAPETKQFKHILSHQHLHTTFYKIKLKTTLPKNTGKIPTSKLHELAWPRLIDKFLNICELY
ncbi:MAG: A/G-specific adenine glycosylase [Sphingobacteriaceae bacterium]